MITWPNAPEAREGVAPEGSRTARPGEDSPWPGGGGCRGGRRSQPVGSFVMYTSPGKPPG